ncbi:MAG: SDR family oxidoreductase [Asgard group archaeon]|nr:SDR family oxidoreductase [Asgard group archaeon]
MRILILGLTGMLGHMLARKLSSDFEIFGSVRSNKISKKIVKNFPQVEFITDIHAERLDGIKKKISEIKPDVIINCIGIIKQLDAAKNPIISIEINSLFPHKLALIAKENNSKLIHFSTDCVFSGNKGNYTIHDNPDPVDLYGRSKLLGEVTENSALTIRSSIIGRELNSKNGLIEWFLDNTGKRILGYKKAIYTGFTTIEMTNIVNFIIQNHLDLEGVYQIASEPITKYDLLKLIKKKLNLEIDIEPTNNVICDRSLIGEEFKEKTKYQSPSWEKMIDEFAKDNSFYSKWLNEE